MAAAGAGFRLGAEDVGEGESRGAEAEGADLEEAAAGDAVAVLRLLAEEGQHEDAVLSGGCFRPAKGEPAEVGFTAIPGADSPPSCANSGCF